MKLKYPFKLALQQTKILQVTTQNYTMPVHRQYNHSRAGYIQYSVLVFELVIL